MSNGAIALERQLDSLFGYYQYNCVELRLESPGGSVDALHYMLRQMTRYEERGKEVAVQSTFLCASAAAYPVSDGKWGHRRVDRSTNLLFHSARVEATGYGMTAATSTNLSNALSGIDHRLVDVLIQRRWSCRLAVRSRLHASFSIGVKKWTSIGWMWRRNLTACILKLNQNAGPIGLEH